MPQFGFKGDYAGRMAWLASRRFNQAIALAVTSSCAELAYYWRTQAELALSEKLIWERIRNNEASQSV